MPEESCNADTQANALFTSLNTDAPTVIDSTVGDLSFIKDTDSDLYSDIASVSIEDLTDCEVDGEGAFDVMMKSVDAHLQKEFKGGRITGDQYAKVYVELVSGVLASATQFVLSKDKVRWDAVSAQYQAQTMAVATITAQVELERARAEANRMSIEAYNASATFALTKLKLATTDAEYCGIQAQTNLYEEQLEKERAQTMDTRTDGVTPIAGILGKQKESLVLDVDTKTYALGNTLPMQLNLISEQRESERAKTMDTRTDGSVVIGSVGKQKDLYTQQIDSFIKDSQYKTAKMYLDGWITQKTLDEGLNAPTQLQNTNVDAVLANFRSETSL